MASILGSNKIFLANQFNIFYGFAIDGFYTGNGIEYSINNGSSWVVCNTQSGTLYNNGYRVFADVIGGGSQIQLLNNTSGKVLIRNIGEFGLDYIEIYYQNVTGIGTNNGTVPFTYTFTYRPCNGNIYFSQNIEDDSSYSGQPFRLTSKLDSNSSIYTFLTHKTLEKIVADIDPCYEFTPLSSGTHTFNQYYNDVENETNNLTFSTNFNVPVEYTCPTTTTLQQTTIPVTTTTIQQTTTTLQQTTLQQTTTIESSIIAQNFDLGTIVIGSSIQDAIFPIPTLINCNFNGFYQLNGSLPSGVTFLVNGNPIGTGTNFSNLDTLTLSVSQPNVANFYNVSYIAQGSCGNSQALITFNTSNPTTLPQTTVQQTTLQQTTIGSPVSFTSTINVIQGLSQPIDFICNGCNSTSIKITQGISCGIIKQGLNSYIPITNNVIYNISGLTFDSSGCSSGQYLLKYICQSQCGNSNESIITINVLPQTTVPQTTVGCNQCADLLYIKTLLNATLQKLDCMEKDLHEIKCKIAKRTTNQY